VTPARLPVSGRSAFPHAYDDLALTALRHVADLGGPDAVRAVTRASRVFQAASSRML